MAELPMAIFFWLMSGIIVLHFASIVAFAYFWLKA